MEREIFRFTALAAALVLSPPAAAATRYVAEDGGDFDNDCLDAGNPCATIGQAVFLANAGDLIEVAEGDYTGPLTIDKSLSLHGAGQGVTKIQAHAQQGMAGDRVITMDGTPTVEVSDVTIRHGTATGNNLGGGLFNDGSALTLANVTISGNSAFSGGGVYNCGSGSLTLIGVTISGNSAGFNGGGMYNCQSVNPDLTNVIFSGNGAFRGGGMYNENSAPALTNVVFGGNGASNCGAGMANDNASPTLTNVTFSGNFAFAGGGMCNLDGSSPLIRNSIFWNNRDDTGVGTARASINNNNSTPLIEFSLMQGCNPAGTWFANCGTDGGDNPADADPLFIDTPDPDDAPTTGGDLRLQAASSAIDAGDNAFVAGVDADLDGNPRIIGAAVDLGPYEAEWLVDDIFRDRFEP